MENIPINTAAIRELARKDLLDLIDHLPVGAKALVLDSSISGPLSLIAEYSVLKEHGIDKIYLLGKELETSCPTVLFLSRPNLENMKIIASHVKSLKKLQRNQAFTIGLIPRISTVCERILEEEGVLGDVELKPFKLNVVPLDNDVLSLELDTAFVDLFQHGDYSCLFSAAQAISLVQNIHGIIPKIYGKGHYSKVLVDMLLRMNREEDEPNLVFPEINRMIIFDRTVDLHTPLLTQLTYEGMIDEIFGIQNSIHIFWNQFCLKLAFLELEPYVSGYKEKRKICLNSLDNLFSRIRDKSFSAIGTILNETAKELQQNYNERHDAKSVTALKEFIGKLGNLKQLHQSLQLHINIRDYIAKNYLGNDFHASLEVQQNLMMGAEAAVSLEYVENMIYDNQPLLNVLKVLCLASVLNGGLKQKQYDFFKAEIFASYGYEHLLSFEALATCNLLRISNGTKSHFPLLKKQLRLKVDDVDEQNPDDVAYVHAVVAPLIARLVEAILKNQTLASSPRLLGNTGKLYSSAWRGLEDCLKVLPGPTIEIDQELPEGVGAPKSTRDTTLVVFLGGCTCAEIAALRFIAEKSQVPRDIAVLTTKITTGQGLISQIIKSHNIK